MKILSDTKARLDTEIRRATALMSALEPDSKEYASAANSLERLCSAEERLYSADEKVAKGRISPDTALMAALGLAEVLLILNYEKIGFISSKAMQFVFKGRFK